MMTVSQFYAVENWRNRFGVRGPLYGPQGHRGHDVAAAAGTAVPALRSGRVVLVAYSSILGWYVVIQVTPEDFDGYCHVMPMVAKGSDIRQGETVGRVAGWGDPHGSAWLGPHLHFTNGGSMISVHTGAVRDPAPVIRRALASIAPAGEGTPIVEDDMFSDDDRQLLKDTLNAVRNTHAGIWKGGSTQIDGVVQTFRYGVLPITAHNQTLIAQQAGRISALEKAVSQLAGGGSIDMAVLEKAAEKGAREALQGVTFKAVGDA